MNQPTSFGPRYASCPDDGLTRLWRCCSVGIALNVNWLPASVMNYCWYTMVNAIEFVRWSGCLLQTGCILGHHRDDEKRAKTCCTGAITKLKLNRRFQNSIKEAQRKACAAVSWAVQTFVKYWKTGSSSCKNYSQVWLKLKYYWLIRQFMTQVVKMIYSSWWISRLS